MRRKLAIHIESNFWYDAGGQLAQLHAQRLHSKPAADQLLPQLLLSFCAECFDLKCSTIISLLGKTQKLKPPYLAFKSYFCHLMKRGIKKTLGFTMKLGDIA